MDMSWTTPILSTRISQIFGGQTWTPLRGCPYVHSDANFLLRIPIATAVRLIHATISCLYLQFFPKRYSHRPDWVSYWTDRFLTVVS
jgi:hypothetical protein